MSKDSWEQECELRRNSEIIQDYYKNNPVYNGEDSCERADLLRHYLNKDFDDYGYQDGY